MEIDFNQSTVTDSAFVFPIVAAGDQPSPPSEIKERVIIIGGNSSANVSIRGTADQREDKPW